MHTLFIGDAQVMTLEIVHLVYVLFGFSLIRSWADAHYFMCTSLPSGERRPLCFTPIQHLHYKDRLSRLFVLVMQFSMLLNHHEAIFAHMPFLVPFLEVALIKLML